MSTATNLVTTTRALVEDGAGLIDAFRQALDTHSAAPASRRFAARILTIGHPRALVQLLDLLDRRETEVSCAR